MTDHEIKENKKAITVLFLPSGAKVVITGTPTVENCKSFVKTLIRADVPDEGE